MFSLSAGLTARAEPAHTQERREVGLEVNLPANLPEDHRNVLHRERDAGARVPAGAWGRGAGAGAEDALEVRGELDRDVDVPVRGAGADRRRQVPTLERANRVH